MEISRGRSNPLNRRAGSIPIMPWLMYKTPTLLIVVGRPNEAPALVKQAVTISPRDPSLGFFYHIMGRAYFQAADYQNAIAWLEKSVRARDNVWYNRAYLISAYALMGRPEVNAALSEYREKFKDWPLERVRNWDINEIQ